MGLATWIIKRNEQELEGPLGGKGMLLNLQVSCRITTIVRSMLISLINSGIYYLMTENLKPFSKVYLILEGKAQLLELAGGGYNLGNHILEFIIQDTA